MRIARILAAAFALAWLTACDQPAGGGEEAAEAPAADMPMEAVAPSEEAADAGMEEAAAEGGEASEMPMESLAPSEEAADAGMEEAADEGGEASDMPMEAIAPSEEAADAGMEEAAADG